MKDMAETIYELKKNGQHSFENDEIESDGILRKAAGNIGLSGCGIECYADTAIEAFEIFFGCPFDSPTDDLPDFFKSPEAPAGLIDYVTTHPHGKGDEDVYMIAPIE